MKDGLINIALCSPRLVLGDVKANAKKCIDMAKKASKTAAVALFPEMSLVGTTLGDLTRNRAILDASLSSLEYILNETRELDVAIIIGMPIKKGSKVYDCSVVICHGNILGIVPSSCDGISHCAEDEKLSLFGNNVPFGDDIIFSAEGCPDFTFALLVGKDLADASFLATEGANIILNPTAIPETVGTGKKIETAVSYLSDSLISAVAILSAGKGESTTDAVYGGRCAVAALGEMLAVGDAFEDNRITYATLDLGAISAKRAKEGFACEPFCDSVYVVEYFFPLRETKIINKPSVSPFLPENGGEGALAEILAIQKNALAERILRSHSRGIVLGLSGGLDSTLALLVAVGAMDILGMPRESVLSVTMPCFGTTKRTRSNAEALATSLGTAFSEINIKDAVNLHFRDIGHDPENHSVVYENSQARERTQILMDLANAKGSLVLGTGDMSELALGFATYNGDHMSMYGVNAGVPKTLMRSLVGYSADCYEKEGATLVAEVLRDILSTPVSPELLPPKDGEIQQCTEDIVGPYELHDFFLYHLLAHDASPEKIVRLALSAFDGRYTEEVIVGWLKVFLRRFTTQQFKRSCCPDGPRVGSISLSPRGGLSMPSDASVMIWQSILGE